jgi:hypothetical protein
LISVAALGVARVAALHGARSRVAGPRSTGDDFIHRSFEVFFSSAQLLLAGSSLLTYDKGWDRCVHFRMEAGALILLQWRGERCDSGDGVAEGQGDGRVDDVRDEEDRGQHGRCGRANDH